MRRNRKGRTRTGAIPTCMAEVSPDRAHEMLWARLITRWLDVSMREYDRALYVSNSGMGPSYYDTVAFFAESHPPQGRA